MDYNVRFYDPYIMMFASPDTIIPDPYNPLDINRYGYARYNPLRYTDPTGHAVDDGLDVGCGLESCLSKASSTPNQTDESKLPSPNDVITTSIVVLDGVSFVISGVEAILADSVGGGIVVIGCGATGLETAGLGCGAFAGLTLQVDMAIASYGSPIGTLENLLGVASTS